MIMDDYQKFVLVNIHPPSWLVNINNSILTNSERRESNEGQHWLSLFDKGPDSVHASGRNLAQLLQREWHPSSVPNGEGIEVAQVQKYVLEQALALLCLRDPDFTHWNSFVSCLQPPWHGIDKDKAAWLENGKPILEQLVATIESKRRSPDWQQDPRRTDYAFLPSTFTLRLKLLDYPQLQINERATGNHDRFAAQLLNVPLEVQDLGLANYGKIKDVTDTALRTHDEVYSSCWIGNFDAHVIKTRSLLKMTEEIILRVELADRLLEEIKFDDENVMATYKGNKPGRVQRRSDTEEDERTPVVRMLRLWVRTGIEEVRMRGVRTGRRLGLDVDF